MSPEFELKSASEQQYFATRSSRFMRGIAAILVSFERGTFRLLFPTTAASVHPLVAEKIAKKEKVTFAALLVAGAHVTAGCHMIGGAGLQHLLGAPKPRGDAMLCAELRSSRNAR